MRDVGSGNAEDKREVVQERCFRRCFTRNPEPEKTQTPNPKPPTLNPKPYNPNLKPRTTNLKSKPSISNTKPQQVAQDELGLPYWERQEYDFGIALPAARPGTSEFLKTLLRESTKVPPSIPSSIPPSVTPSLHPSIPSFIPPSLHPFLPPHRVGYLSLCKSGGGTDKICSEEGSYLRLIDVCITQLWA